MNRAAVFHRAEAPYSYAVDEQELVIRLETGLEIERVFLLWGDPFEKGIMGGDEGWGGVRQKLEHPLQVDCRLWWQGTVKPPYRRCRYYFEIHQGGEVWFYGEDGMYPIREHQPGECPAPFYQPWMNPADIPVPPAWVKDTVWYQIFPDRFCRGGKGEWATPWRSGPVTNKERFGGNFKGIEEKLDYLADLGINGIYLTPICRADSVHKYDTQDYETLDPDFGTREDFIRLVDQAHQRGIRVMVDGVFNHSGAHFPPWLDVVEQGPASPFWDWFMVRDWPLPETDRDTRDGRYASFAFAHKMPKLNTNNPQVADYFARLCARWVADYKVDGIRFDVGNEVSHCFLKQVRRQVRAIRGDVYLLGEIWHDASPWLEGDEYDAVMNYPLKQTISHFFAHQAWSAQRLEWTLTRCLGMYRRQTTQVMFQLLDSHDTDRLITRTADENVFFQQLAMLFTLPGSPCIYYGTEVALPGGHDPDCRRCMPWDELENPEVQVRIEQVKELIRLRRENRDLREGTLVFHSGLGNTRWVWYDRNKIQVLLNCGDQAWPLEVAGEILFARKQHENVLLPGGICIRRIKHA